MNICRSGSHNVYGNDIRCFSHDDDDDDDDDDASQPQP